MSWDRVEGSLDSATAIEDQRDLSRRDAGAAPVGRPEVRLVEDRRARGVAKVQTRVGFDNVEHHPQGILDADAVPKNDDGPGRPVHGANFTARPRG